MLVEPLIGWDWTRVAQHRNRTRYAMVHVHPLFAGGISRPLPISEDTAMLYATHPNYIVYVSYEGKKVRMLETPNKQYPEGSECPIHNRVHNSHGWYVCLMEEEPEDG
jgi:hypothetical protein